MCKSDRSALGPPAGMSGHPSQIGTPTAENIELVEQLVIRMLGVDRGSLQHPKRGRAPMAYARQLAIYAMHVSLGLSLTASASVYGRDRTTASHACQKIEDLRDGFHVDGLMETIETACVRWRHVFGERIAS